MNKEILRLAIPNILSNISVPLLSSVDTALMGHLSTQHIGAVGIAAMFFNFIYWNFGFLRMGTTGITAQAYGKKDSTQIIHTLSRASLVAMLLTSIVLIFQYPIFQLCTSFFESSDDQLLLVQEYFNIRIWDAPATIGLVVFMGWFFGMQNAIYPLILTISINIINISTSFVFVYHWDMGVAGVAYGTVIAQYMGLLFAIGLFLFKYRYLLKEFNKKTWLALETLVAFLNINKDIFIRTFCLSLAFAFFYRQSNQLDATILAVNIVLMQFLSWMSFGVDGFAFAAESLVGKYHGAKQPKKLQKAIKLSFVWGMFFALLYSLSYWLFGNSILSIFTDQEAILTEAQTFLFWMWIYPILGTPCYIWDGIFVGLTASKAMRNSMFLAITTYFLSYYWLVDYWGNHGLWLALLLFLVARGLFQSVLYYKRGTNLL
ncbi:MAG: MATE family efflux transporter [Aureispira sp.]|nr:MATE family efflux transporter [Aureispira sp.]